MESGLSLISLGINIILFCAMDVSYPGQSHTCLKRFMKINHKPQWATIETMKPVTLFLTAVRIMNFNITIWLPVSMVQLAYYAWQLSLSLSLYRYRLMQVMRRDELRYSVPCCTAQSLSKHHNGRNVNVLQQETLSLLDNVSIIDA